MKEIEKYCQYCGKKLERKRFGNRLEDFGVFTRRKYCNRDCMRKAMLKTGINNQEYRVAHQTAKNIMELSGKERKCYICGKKEHLDVHHIDKNYQNNTIENLIYLCRSCHTKVHKEKHYCIICGDKVKGLGYCNKHYIRFKKYGNPLYTKYNKI